MQDAVLSLRLIAGWTISLPPLALVLCVLGTLLLQYDKVPPPISAPSLAILTSLPTYQATYTHCEVPELLPSISAVIGGSDLPRFVWTLSVALTTGPRLVFCKLQQANLREKFNSKSTWIQCNFYFNCAEILSLLTLSLGKVLETASLLLPPSYIERSYITK